MQFEILDIVRVTSKEADTCGRWGIVVNNTGHHGTAVPVDVWHPSARQLDKIRANKSWRNFDRLTIDGTLVSYPESSLEKFRSTKEES